MSKMSSYYCVNYNVTTTTILLVSVFEHITILVAEKQVKTQFYFSLSKSQNRDIVSIGCKIPIPIIM